MTFPASYQVRYFRDFLLSEGKRYQELIRDIIDMVKYPSISRPGEGGCAMGKACKECADAFMSLGEKYGFETENDDYFCASIISRGIQEREIGFLGHMDVVPEGDGWEYPPFSAFESQGFVVGRGSLDNKGPTLSCLYVMRCMKDLGIQLNHTVRLIAGFNEECGMKDVEHYLTTHTPPECTLVCDGAWTVCIGEKGILRLSLSCDFGKGNILSLDGGTSDNSVPETAAITLHSNQKSAIASIQAQYDNLSVCVNAEEVSITAAGIPAHAGMPEQGKNAVTQLLSAVYSLGLVQGEHAQKIETLTNWFADDYGTGFGIDFSDSPSGKTTCVVTGIHLENSKLVIGVNIRYAVTQDPEKMIACILDQCEKHGFAVESMEHMKSRYVSPEDPVVKLLDRTCKEFLEHKVDIYSMGGGTHARKFPNALPYGTFMFSPESPFGIGHGIHEAVCVDYLLKAIRIYVISLLRLDRYFCQRETESFT